MKRIIILMILTSWAWLSQAQEFNQRFSLGSSNCSFAAIEVTDTAYYVTGIIADINPPYYTGTCFNKFDTLGNLISSTWYTSPTRSIEMWKPDLTKTPNGTFSQAGYFRDTMGHHGLVLRFNEAGDTLWSKGYYNPHDSSNFMRSDIYVALPNDDYIIISTVANNLNGGNGDCLIERFNHTHNKVWSLNINEFDYNYLWMDHAQILTDSSLLIGCYMHTYNSTYNFNQGSFRLINIDLNGNLLSEYKSPDHIDSMYYGAHSVLVTEDKSRIIATEKYDTVIQPNGSLVLAQNNAVVKLDSNNNILWHKIILGDLYGGGWEYGMRKILPLPNNEFYVAGFIHRLVNEMYSYNGYILKMNEDGDSLGSREINFITQGLSEHRIHDAELLPNGQIVFCGESQAAINGQPIQQGWLGKITIPEFTAITEEEIAKGVPTLHLYPNPVSSLLSVELRTEKPIENAQLNIISMNGQLLQQHLVRGQHGSLFMMEVDDLANGVYVLQLVMENGEMVSEQFLVQH